MSATEQKDYILLKWGGLKGWRINNPKALALMEKYYELGVSMSAMTQDNSLEHKEMLCAIIKAHRGSIQNDWSGERYTKKKAIDYIMNYGND